MGLLTSTSWSRWARPCSRTCQTIRKSRGNRPAWSRSRRPTPRPSPKSTSPKRSLDSDNPRPPPIWLKHDYYSNDDSTHFSKQVVFTELLLFYFYLPFSPHEPVQSPPSPFAHSGHSPYL